METNPKYVTFEQAKWLEKKGIYTPFWKENYFRKSDGKLMDEMRAETFNSDIHIYAPQQWEVVEWLLIKHGIWVCVDLLEKDAFFYSINKLGWKTEQIIYSKEYNTPQKAYSAAFDYIKDNNLI